MYIYGEVFSTEVLGRGFRMVCGDVAARSSTYYIYTAGDVLRAWHDGDVSTDAEASVSFSDLWCLTAVFASAKRMRKLTANAIGGKPVGRGRSRTDKGSSGR